MDIISSLCLHASVAILVVFASTVFSGGLQVDAFHRVDGAHRFTRTAQTYMLHSNILDDRVRYRTQSGSTSASLALGMALAPYKQRRSHNADGNLYVDESCIDCDVCRWMCPSVYGRRGVKSVVHTQPRGSEEKLRAYAAMLSCPVGSIRTVCPDPVVKDAMALFPSPIDIKRLPGVFHLGFHSADSFGATPYLIVRHLQASTLRPESVDRSSGKDIVGTSLTGSSDINGSLDPIDDSVRRPPNSITGGPRERGEATGWSSSSKCDQEYYDRYSTI